MQTNLQPNDILRERYQIVGLIGTGGMGAVYLAHDTRLVGRQCALKETRFAPNLTPEVLAAARQQFYQEASILAQLDHPGLPKVSDYFSTGERDYLVMDYIPGSNLQEIRQQAQRENRFLEEATVLAWVEQLADTLIYLHSRQPPVLHRDIKPANIKLTPDNRLKLVDFGLVKPIDPNDPATLSGFQGLGSLPYAPLEQYLDHLGRTDERSDLYAFGATIYHLLTHHTPASAQERFLDTSILPPPQSLNPRISPHVAQAILQAMAPHPKDRPASVKAWLELLKPAAPLAPTLPQDWRMSLQQNSWLMAVAAVLFIAALWLTFG